ncbi:MAG: substrate-binding domain-containing protein [Deltaproteobacteria bacterium]|nr:substrate-binding domain-containing protein [Deltaproteobacteria bacterium]
MQSSKKSLVFFFLFFTIQLYFSCSYTLASKKGPVIFVTTTSVYDSGLLEELIPLFEREKGYVVKTIAVGSGQAIVLGKRKEADILLVHSPEEEKEFMVKGFGSRRRTIMYNYFVVVGPKNDPCGITTTRTAKEALRKIAERKCIFLSRGDNSGTHMVEKRLWSEIGIDPSKENWYQETGQGMGLTLKMAFDKGAYTLSDSATYLIFSKALKTNLSFVKDERLLNIYSVLEVKPSMSGRSNPDGARALSDFLISDRIQRIIGNFGKDKYGSSLFIPCARKKMELEKWR